VGEHVNLVSREILDLIQLVVNGYARRKVPHRRKCRAIDDDGPVCDAPGMLVETSAEHLTKFRPRKKRRGR
jgi:hypothetical protein